MNVYLDNASTTRLSHAALDAMLPAFTQNYGNASALHMAGQQALESIENAREQIAGFLHCDKRGIVFTSGGTEADNQALRTLASLGATAGRRHFISTVFEHHAVLHTLKKLETEGFEVTLLPVSPEGFIAPSQVEEAIRPDTALVSVMYANNEIGTIQPVPEIGRICRKHNVLFHTDAVQAAGHIPIDMEISCIDLLSLSAHKFGGPKGIGALCAPAELPLCRLMEGGGQERGFRPGTENVPGILGMAAALKFACERMDADAARLTALRDRLIRGLSEIPGSYLNGALESRLPGNVNFSFSGIRGEALMLLLDSAGIAASAGSACTAGSPDPSHVLLALGRSPELASNSLRLTLSGDNTEEEVAYCLNVIPELIGRLRNSLCEEMSW